MPKIIHFKFSNALMLPIYQKKTKCCSQTILEYKKIAKILARYYTKGSKESKFKVQSSLMLPALQGRPIFAQQQSKLAPLLNVLNGK